MRTGHSTTTLITSGESRIIVDPGLPEAALVARLQERANLSPRQITHVFLTSFRPDTHRAIRVFEDADWFIHADEREAVGVPLAEKLKDISVRGGAEDAALADLIRSDIAILQRCSPAPESLAERVDLFPLPGVTPGLCGLLLEGTRHTTVVCGDAIPTVEHLEEGKILPNAADLERARESFEEAVEIADLIVLGRDNVVVNPTKRAF